MQRTRRPTFYKDARLCHAINSWWRHQMETFSALLAICAGNSPVPGEFPTQRPVTRSFDVYFDLIPNKRLRKQSWGWWFGALWCQSWRHRNELFYFNTLNHVIVSLSHWGLVMMICVKELGQLWFNEWLCKSCTEHVVLLLDTWEQTSVIFAPEREIYHEFENAVCKISEILLQR